MCVYMLNEDKQPRVIELFELHLFECFGFQITAQEIWDKVKQSEKPPHIGDIYTELIFSAFKRRLEEKFPDIQVKFNINGVNSYLYINDEKLESFLNIIDYL